MLVRFSFRKLIFFTIGTLTFFYVYNTAEYLRPKKASTNASSEEYSIQEQRVTDAECSNDSTWVKLNQDLYFKRTNFFYLNDFKLIRFSYLVRAHAAVNLTVDIRLIHRQKRRLLKYISKYSDIKQRFEYHRGSYRVKIADILVDLSSRIGDINNVELFVNFFTSTSQTHEPIKVQVKNLASLNDEKSSTVLCSKILYLNNFRDYLNLKWWIDLNLQIGHQTLSFYENLFDVDFFQDKRDYIELEKFRCFPNFLQHRKSEFLNSLKELKYNNVFSYASTDMLHVQITNECYMRHGDSVRYVAVLDSDETIIPRVSPQYFTVEDFARFVMQTNFDQIEQVTAKLNEMTCDRYDSKGEQMQAYLDELATIYKHKNVKTMFFQQAFYLKNEMIAQLFQLLESELAQFDKSRNNLINLQKIDPESSYRSFNLTFRLENDQDIQYAQNLIKCFRKFIQPFIEKNVHKFSKKSENYQRFFALISFTDNQFLMGKTIHATTHVHPLCVHTMCGRRDKLISYNYGHLSHFRGSFRFKKNLILNIKQLVFDLNYFKCFVQPLINL